MKVTVQIATPINDRVVFSIEAQSIGTSGCCWDTIIIAVD